MKAKSTKTVLYLIESLNPCGAEHALVRLATGINRQRWKPVVWVLRDGRMDLKQALTDANIEVVDQSRFGWKLTSRLQLSKLVRSSARMRRLRPDIVHSFSICGYGNEPWTVKTSIGTKYVVRKASERMMGIKQVWEWKYRKADAVVALTQRMRKQLLDTFCDTPLEKKLHVIPNGVDVEEFSPGDRNGQLRQELGLGSHTQLIASVGRLSTRKNHAFLLKSFAQAKSRLADNCQLVIAGRGGDESEESALRALAQQLKISDRVRLIGHRDNIASVLRECDVFVLSGIADSEGASNALLEAMSTGLACITTRNGSEEVIDDGSDGIVVSCDDEAEMSTAIHRLCAHSATRDAMGVSARTKVANHFSIQETISANERLYGTLTTR